MLKYHQVVGVEVNKHEKARILIYYTIIFTTSTGMFSKRLLGGGYPILPTSYATNSGKCITTTMVVSQLNWFHHQKEKEGASHKNNDEIHNMVILHL